MTIEPTTQADNSSAHTAQLGSVSTPDYAAHVHPAIVQACRDDAAELQAPAAPAGEDPRISPDVRLPFEHGYRIPEIVAALGVTRRVDPTALAAELVAKATARGDDPAAITLGPRRPRATEQRSRAARIAIKTAGWSGISAGVLQIIWTWQHPPAESGLPRLPSLPIELPSPASTAAVVLPVLLVCGLVLIRDHRRRLRTAYTSAELAEFDVAVIDWPSNPDRLDDYPNHAVLHKQWAQRQLSPSPIRTPETIERHKATGSGMAAVFWPEPHLVAVANLLGRDIRSSRAWNSDLFDTHRVRIDLEHTLTDIRQRAHRIWRAKANLVPATTHQPDDLITQRNAEITAAADRAWTTLVELVRQLHDYKQQLAPIDAMLAEIEAIEQSTLRITAAAVRQLDIDAAGNEIHSDTIAAAGAELADLNANLEARLDVLHQALTAPANALATIN